MNRSRLFWDTAGRQLEVAAPPSRIISLVPSLTEALFAFGAGNRVVGVTRYCVEPAASVRGKAKVGGTKNVDIAAIGGLNPDLVVANVEENTRADVEALEDSGIRVFLAYARTVAGAIDELRILATIADVEDTASPVLESAERELHEALAANEHRTPARTFCPVWRNPWMTIGPDTYIHDVLRVCGAENVFADASERYPAIDLAAVAERRPELVLLPDEPYKFGAKHESEVIESMGDVRINLVDGRMLCWYGPRIAESLRRLQQIIHGDTGM